MAGKERAGRGIASGRNIRPAKVVYQRVEFWQTPLADHTGHSSGAGTRDGYKGCGLARPRTATQTERARGMSRKLPPITPEYFATPERGEWKTDEDGVFIYFPQTGEMFWLARRNGVRGDRRAGCVIGGYLLIEHNNKPIMAHRLAWKIMTGEWPDKFIDHINGNRVDNRFCNLRLADKWQNARNAKTPKTNTSGFKGVCWDKDAKKWLAQINIDGRSRKIGKFSTAEAAHAAYVKAATDLYGEFARFN